MPRKSFSKFHRPKEPQVSGVISDRDLDLLAAMLRFRFSPASELVRIVGGNERVTQRRLLGLWKAHLVNRWAFPSIPTSEFHYYLDNPQSLQILAEHRGLQIAEPMLEELRNNREKDYAQAAVRGQHMQLGFLKHWLMISRMHYMLEMACKQSSGKVHLEDWYQGAELAGHKVELPHVTARRQEGTNQYLWHLHNETVNLPVEPDALFTLRFPDRPENEQLVHFCYEADRGTMVTTDMLKKMRAYYHFIKKEQKHKEAFGVHPIRAVLIETTDESRGNKLMELVSHPLVAGPQKRAGLFWFSISPLFTDPAEGSPPGSIPGQALPRYLDHPEGIFDSIWALPDRTMHALGDAENSPQPAAAKS
jgi:hypothetical protein